MVHTRKRTLVGAVFCKVKVVTATASIATTAYLSAMPRVSHKRLGVAGPAVAHRASSR